MKLVTLEKTGMSLNGTFKDAKTGKVVNYDPDFETVLKLAVKDRTKTVATTHKSISELKHHATHKDGVWLPKKGLKVDIFGRFIT